MFWIYVGFFLFSFPCLWLLNILEDVLSSLTGIKFSSEERSYFIPALFFFISIPFKLFGILILFLNLGIKGIELMFYYPYFYFKYKALSSLEITTKYEEIKSFRKKTQSIFWQDAIRHEVKSLLSHLPKDQHDYFRINIVEGKKSFSLIYFLGMWEKSIPVLKKYSEENNKIIADELKYEEERKKRVLEREKYKDEALKAYEDIKKKASGL